MKTELNNLYQQYNKRKFVHPDPLEFLYNYQDKRDVEVVGLIASSLAYGRVAQILKSVSIVLDKMGKSPFIYLENSTPQKIKKDFKGFKHRFTTDVELSYFLIGIKIINEKYGSIENMFEIEAGEENILPALSKFVTELSKLSGMKKNSLFADPSRGSACKRHNLFLRWMVRTGDVDLGCWKNVKPDKLVVPLDTHMFDIAKKLGFTCRKQANMKSALEITSNFKKINSKDPVRYDFVLTRFGIRYDLDKKDLIKRCKRG